MRMGERAPVPDRDFYGRDVTKLIPKRLPETDGIPCKNGLPSPGDRIRMKDGREGSVDEVGELAGFGDHFRSIRVQFDDGDRWFVAMVDVDDHWTP